MKRHRRFTVSRVEGLLPLVSLEADDVLDAEAIAASELGVPTNTIIATEVSQLLRVRPASPKKQSRSLRS